MLDTDTFKTGLKNLMNQMKDPSGKKTSDDFAEGFANLMETYIKTATVNAGIPVTTTGTATAQTGSTSGPGTIS